MQAEAQGERAEVVAAGGGVLRGEAGADEADQIAVRLGRGHAGVAGEVGEAQGLATFEQGMEQAAGDLDRLDAGAGGFGGWFGHCGVRAVGLTVRWRRGVCFCIE